MKKYFYFLFLPLFSFGQISVKFNTSYSQPLGSFAEPEKGSAANAGINFGYGLVYNPVKVFGIGLGLQYFSNPLNVKYYNERFSKEFYSAPSLYERSNTSRRNWSILNIMIEPIIAVPIGDKNNFKISAGAGPSICFTPSIENNQYYHSAQEVYIQNSQKLTGLCYSGSIGFNRIINDNVELGLYVSYVGANYSDYKTTWTNKEFVNDVYAGSKTKTIPVKTSVQEIAIGLNIGWKF